MLQLTRPRAGELGIVADGRGREWWRGAVIYQIYPRSFQDSDGDGVGDLPGITRRLEHVAALGVDAIWISPFFASPMADFGYDVADYRAVDPLFGTLQDFDGLLARAHELGLRVMVDLVLSHTSDRHAWFQESRASRDNPKADWYVFADARPDGTPPNNWLSVFGGVAWQWEPRRGQYYLHNFLVEQPDLNVHDPAVVEALLGEARFWLERGVDGFRLDAIDFALHDRALRDNPPRPAGEAFPGGVRRAIPYARQRHVHSKAQPALRATLLEPLRTLSDRYGEIALLGEISGDGALERAAAYTSGETGLHFAYTFDLLHAPFTPTALRRVVEALEAEIGDGWPCWSFGNHDVRRPPTRFGGETVDPALARLLPALLASLRGTICLYQGEELGLPEAELAFRDLQDPVGLRFWPESKGRDGCRTPMPWTADAANCGFSSAKPWLPVPAAHRGLAVDRQRSRPDSTLTRTRRFLAWRKGQPALIRGEVAFLDVPEPVLAFTREHAGERLFCTFNLAPQPASIEAPGTVEAVPGHGFESEVEARSIQLRGYGAFFGRLS